MKLLLLTAISEFEKDIKLILKKSEVRSYSLNEVTGYKDISEEAVDNNWFAGEINETKSIVFYAFVKKENTEVLFNLVNEFNSQQKSLSHIHVVVLNIEKTNEPIC